MLIRIMSFNLRNCEAADGPNCWANRTDLVLQTIRKFNPDLLGTQEMLAPQTDFLDAQLREYTRVGVGRADGHRGGEFNGVFFRTERFELIDHGTVWLSETPDRPSVGW